MYARYSSDNSDWELRFNAFLSSISKKFQSDFDQITRIKILLRAILMSDQRHSFIWNLSTSFNFQPHLSFPFSISMIKWRVFWFRVSDKGFNSCMVYAILCLCRRKLYVFDRIVAYFLIFVVEMFLVFIGNSNPHNKK